MDIQMNYQMKARAHSALNKEKDPEAVRACRQVPEP